MSPDTPRGLAARSAAVARCASLVEDDRLLQAARLADAATSDIARANARPAVCEDDDD